MADANRAAAKGELSEAGEIHFAVTGGNGVISGEALGAVWRDHCGGSMTRNSDKVYHAAIEPKGDGYIVTFAYGGRGNTLNTGVKNDTPVPLETATKLFNKLIASKVAKGYQPDGEPTKPYLLLRKRGCVAPAHRQDAFHVARAALCE